MNGDVRMVYVTYPGDPVVLIKTRKDSVWHFMWGQDDTACQRSIVRLQCDEGAELVIWPASGRLCKHCEKVIDMMTDAKKTLE